MCGAVLPGAGPHTRVTGALRDEGTLIDHTDGAAREISVTSIQLQSPMCTVFRHRYGGTGRS